MINNSGLDILYHDCSIVIINKPAGMLSIPGRGPDKTDSAAFRICTILQDCIKQPSVHRLDMDTSGLLLFALTAEAHRNLSIQFQKGEVSKKYIAVLNGLIDDRLTNQGRIELKFRLDPENRPYQVFDPVKGKKGITLWKKLDEAHGQTRIGFKPLTGRTHQLRLHSAHKQGLGCPIAGDRLYGNSNDKEHENGIRMMLHASQLGFTHPETGSQFTITSDPPF